MYAGDFETAISEAEKVRELDPDYFKGWLPVAMKAMADGDEVAARGAFENMSGIGFRGASTAALGLADLAIYNGDYDSARAILQQGIAEDEAAGSQYFAATKYIALAELELASGNDTAALESLETGLGISSREAQSVPAALMYLRTGDVDRARDIAAGLGQQLQPKARAHSLLIDGLIALGDGDHVTAIDTLSSALELADLWLVRFYIGRAYLEAGFYAEALDEFMACQGRNGEATAVFLDDLPTYRYMAALPYWLGRAQEGLGMTDDARENYAQYVGYRPEGDPLADDARQRLQ